ncbi:hypothetical protein GCM10009665_75390 [Kitasatospora nipponensis]|uniref:Uncharacterized protein n=1 Tax=Kitasatospora nipponensis TaxID=258049 RepID=A0ABN1T8M7_9ACTN
MVRSRWSIGPPAARAATCRMARAWGVSAAKVLIAAVCRVVVAGAVESVTPAGDRAGHERWSAHDPVGAAADGG